MRKSQSAMEYLMTYGWAILIVAVVLGAIYSLGLFNGASLAPKVTPGSCQVYRPNGPGTTQYINLEGTCTNELPQYTGIFDGVSSYIAVSPTDLITGNQITISSWAKLSSASSQPYFYIYSQGSTGLQLCGGVGDNRAFFRLAAAGGSVSIAGGYACGLGVWRHYVATYNGTNTNLYVNGALVATALANGLILSTYSSGIGRIDYAGTYWFNGSISNIQIYNTSLDANSVKALYSEGIGGAPINLQSLVGWWPLNGNTNDYSGNMYNGAPTNVIYSNQWWNGYTIH